jgi:hypothetical protein
MGGPDEDDRLSPRERRLALAGAASIWGLLAIGVMAFASVGNGFSLAELRRPPDDPSGWKIVTTDPSNGRTWERPANAGDMLWERYSPLVVVAFGVGWAAASGVLFAQAGRRRRTFLTRWVLRAMGERG